MTDERECICYEMTEENADRDEEIAASIHGDINHELADKVRQLIHDEAKKHGMSTATCLATVSWVQSNSIARAAHDNELDACYLSYLHMNYVHATVHTIIHEKELN